MRLVLAATATVALVAACAGGDAGKAATDSAASQATAAVTPPVITIVARDFAYDAPDTVTAGMVTLKLVNQGPDLHHVQLLKLDDGKTVADLTEGLKHMTPGSPPPPWVHDVAGPNTPVPGGEVSLTEELAAGNYAIICFIPGADHIPHAMKGMVRALTVVPAAANAPLAAAPVADITVNMTDYAWAVSPAITPGKHIIKLTNSATQSHEMVLAELAPGKTAAELAAWIENQKGPPPGKPMGGISGMPNGGVAYLPIDLPAGEYALLCFLPDAKDGKPHVAHGMLTQFTVK